MSRELLTLRDVSLYNLFFSFFSKLAFTTASISYFIISIFLVAIENWSILHNFIGTFPWESYFTLYLSSNIHRFGINSRFSTWDGKIFEIFQLKRVRNNNAKMNRLQWVIVLRSINTFVRCAFHRINEKCLHSFAFVIESCKIVERCTSQKCNSFCDLHRFPGAVYFASC